MINENIPVGSCNNGFFNQLNIYVKYEGNDSQKGNVASTAQHQFVHNTNNSVEIIVFCDSQF